MSVVVLGDVGRSPRMLYHALALASGVAEVEVIGYAGSPVHAAIRDHAHIRWHFLRAPRPPARPTEARLRFVVRASGKIVRECLQLFRLLVWTVRKPDVILVQNPPAIPTLLVAVAAARLRAARLVVDWHNFGYTMLALRLGPRHPLVRLAKRYEGTVGRRADRHLCVSDRMRVALRDDWGIADAVVLYDRPAAQFAPTSPDQRAARLRWLRDTIVLPRDEGDTHDRSRRPALLVSPTSWTADEDFGVLLDAVRQCDELIRAHEQSADGRAFPSLVVVLTGRGPLRGHYEAQIARLTLRKIHLRTLWLEAEDYPLLLGAADLGLCLHRSSSGLDLPMKIADLFGSGLPVCALDYGACLTEVVQHGVNGLVFATSTQLAEQLYALFQGFPDDTPLLDRLRRNVEAAASPRWADEWNAVARAVFTR